MIYMGHYIYECERVDGEHQGRWIVQTFHSVGLAWSDENCPHFQTLAAAKAAIRASAATAATAATRTRHG